MAKKYKVSSNFLLREIGGECVLVPIIDGGLFDNSMISLNETSAFLWKEFQEPKTIETVINHVMEHYQSSEEEIRTDILGYISEHVRYGLLEEIGDNK